jgi:hypothetical protein
MVRGPKRAGGDEGGAVTGEARDAMHTRRLNGFGEGHRRQHRGEAPRQHRRARPGRAEEEDVVGRPPASA